MESFQVDNLLPFIPIVFIIGVFTVLVFVLPKYIYRSELSYYERRNRRSELGEEEMQATCGGSIGMVRLRGPFISLKIHREGILIKALFLKDLCILKREIKFIDAGDTFLGTKNIRIEHDSPEIISPVTLGFYNNADAIINRMTSMVLENAEQ